MESELIRVVDALPGLVWTALPDGNVDFVNQGWCDYTGCGPDEGRGDGWQVALHPDDLTDHLANWRAACSCGEPGEMEARLRRFDGEYRRFLVRVRPVTDADGKIIKWFGLGVDIEDIRRAENASALEREIELRSLVDSMPAFVALASPSGEVEYFNRTAREYIGSNIEDLTGSKAAGLVHPDDIVQVLAAWKASVATGDPYDMEHRLRCTNGAYRWFDVRGRPLRDGQGRITRWCVVDVDISDHKHDEALLAGEKKLLEMVARGDSRADVLKSLCQLVEHTLEGCYCSVILVNESGTRMEHGAAPRLPGSFVAANIGQPVHGDAGPCPMAVCLNQQVIAANLETEARWENGWSAMAMSYGIRACWSTPIAAENGEALGAFAIYHDQPRQPTPRDIALIDQLTHVASIAIERQRSQVALAEALEEVRASEDRLRTIIDSMPGFVWSAKPDGGVDFLNQRWCDYTGIRMEDALGMCWALTIHPDDVDQLQAHWQASIQSGEANEAEARLRRHDGMYRWFLIRTVPVQDGAGNVLKWYGQNTDIDERKRSETLLAGEKKMLSLIAGGSSLPTTLECLCDLVQASIDGALCSVVLIDPHRTRPSKGAPLRLRLQAGAAPDVPDGLLDDADGRAVDENASPVTMCAARIEPIVSDDLASEARWPAWCPAALSNGISRIASIPIMANCGMAVGVLSLMYREPTTPVTAQDNLLAQFTHLASIAIDRALSEAALRQSEAFLGKAQQLSHTGTFSWRLDNDEIVWSEEIYRIAELDPTITPSFDLIFSRIHPEDIPSLQETFIRQRNAPSDFEHEHRLLMADGSVKYLYLVAHATQHEDGGVEYIAALQDITQRRHSDEALGKVRSELAHVARVATLGVLTASIAHEVNQPLAGIITNANTCLRMLGASPPNVDGARETARRTIRDGNRASDVIKRLRALFAKKEIAAEPVDLNEATREIIAMLLGEFQRTGVSLQPEFDEDLPPVLGDRVQLQQVILNLLVNAADSMRGINDRPRHIVVRTSRDDSDCVHLDVKDAGVGFDPQSSERIFEAFYTTKGDGMGIGLSISRSIIESHDGQMWAVPNEGLGATFSFCIPRMPEGNGNAHATGVAKLDPEEYVDHVVEKC